MCGRYYRKSDKQAIAEHFAASVYDFELKESYNVAPQSTQPVVRVNGETGEREIALMRWGLIPYWAKDAKVGYSTINAKSETVATNRLFREAFERRRCLVPADGFYEWKLLHPESGKVKQPYGIGLKDGSLHAFAGIWERWKDQATRQMLETFSILTTEPNELTASIHSRMPVILAKRDYARWLGPFEAGMPPIDLLRPYAAEEMMVWPVGTAVGNARNDDASLLEPVARADARANARRQLLW